MKIMVILSTRNTRYVFLNCVYFKMAKSLLQTYTLLRKAMGKLAAISRLSEISR